MDRLLVTGGAGFIGSHFVRRMVTAGTTVVNLDKLTYAGRLANLKDLRHNRNHIFVKGDICNRKLVAKLTGRVDGIVNFAAESHVDRSIREAAAFVRTNITGTHVLLEAARKAKLRFLQISSDEVYGSILNGSFRETDRLNPSSPYSASKAAADQLVMAYNRTYGLDTVITRSTNNYGPNQHPEKMIPRFIVNAMRDKPLPLYGDGQHVRDWIHVSDNSAAIDLTLRAGRSGEIYNVSARTEKRNVEVASEVLRILGKPRDLIQYVVDRPGHDRRYSLDSSKLRNLGWKLNVNFPEGLRSTVEWYRSNASWWRLIS